MAQIQKGKENPKWNLLQVSMKCPWVLCGICQHPKWDSAACRWNSLPSQVGMSIVGRAAVHTPLYLPVRWFREPSGVRVVLGLIS